MIFEDFVVEPDAGELERLLGRIRSGDGGEQRSSRNGRIAETLEWARAEAEGLLKPRGIYAMVSGAELAGPKSFERLERMAVCVCTIGPALEERARALIDGGKVFPGFMLDTVGSAAAEAVAEFMAERIAEAAERSGLRTSCRASPGYGDWDVSGQRRIFDVLPAGRIGVELTEGMMMRPLKSVSFSVHVAREPVRLRSENSCGNCDIEDCPYHK